MHSILRLILCIAVVSLAACASHKNSVKASHELAACKMKCQQSFNACNQVCFKNCRQCSTCSSAMTAKSYNQYKHQQCVQGGIIARNLNSYRDPLQCRKTTCECPADYRVCIQSCAGVIHKRLQVPPTCC